MLAGILGRNGAWYHCAMRYSVSLFVGLAWALGLGALACDSERAITTPPDPPPEIAKVAEGTAISCKGMRDPALPPSVSPEGLAISPADHDFSPLPAGKEAEPAIFTVSNQGSTTVNALGVTVNSPGFSIARNGCTSALAPGASCTLEIRFSMQRPGTAMGSLTAGYGPAQSKVGACLSGSAI